MCYVLTSKKTFDSVAHNLLLQKTEKLDNGGNFPTIVASYLADRQQNVKIYYCISETTPVNSDATQGSLLSSLLFIIYVNDLSKEVTEIEVFGYADDFNLVTSMPEKIQKDLSKVED